MQALLFVECETQQSLLDQARRALNDVKAKGEVLNQFKGGFNVTIDEKHMMSFLEAIAREGVLVKNVTELGRRYSTAEKWLGPR